MEAPPREGGFVRRTITLGPALRDYVDDAFGESDRLTVVRRIADG